MMIYLIYRGDKGGRYVSVLVYRSGGGGREEVVGMCQV